MNFSRKLVKAMAVATTCATVASPMSVLAAPVADITAPIAVTIGQATDFGAMFEAMFNAEEYAQMYPEVAKAVGNSKEALLKHYLRYGLFEGKRPSFKVSPTAAMTMASQYRAILGPQAMGGDTIANLKLAAANPLLQQMLSYAIISTQTVATTGELPNVVSNAIASAVAPTPTYTVSAGTNTETPSEEGHKEEKKEDSKSSIKALNCNLVYVTDADENTRVYRLDVDLSGYTCEQISNFTFVYANASALIEGVSFDAESGIFLVDKNIISEEQVIELVGTIKILDENGNTIAKGTGRQPVTSTASSQHEVCKGLYEVLLGKLSDKESARLEYEAAVNNYNTLSGQLESLQDELDDALDELEDARDVVEGLEIEIAGLKDELEALIDASEDGTILTSYSELEAAKLALASAIEAKELADADVEIKTEAYNTALSEYNTALSEYNTAQGVVTALEGEISALNGEITTINNNIQTITANKEAAETSLSENGGMVALETLSDESEETEGSIANLTKAVTNAEAPVLAKVAIAGGKDADELTDEEISDWITNNASDEDVVALDAAKTALTNANIKKETLERIVSEIRGYEGQLTDNADEKSEKEGLIAEKEASKSTAQATADAKEDIKNAKEEVKNNASTAKDNAISVQLAAATAVENAQDAVTEKKEAYETAIAGNDAITAKQSEINDKEASLETANETVETKEEAVGDLNLAVNEKIAEVTTASESVDNAYDTYSDASDEAASATDNFVSAGGYMGEDGPVDPDETF